MAEEGQLSLLSLPLEIRLEVYNLLLTLPSPASTEPKPVKHSHSYSHHSPKKKQQDLIQVQVPEPTPRPGAKLHPAILSVCNQTYTEAVHTLYRLNRFVADCALLTAVPRLRSWYPPVPPSPLTTQIRRWHIRIRLDSPPPWPAATVAAAFTNAEELVLDLWQATFMGGVGADVLRRFEGVRGVRRPRVLGTPPGFEGYVAWLVALMKMPVLDGWREGRTGEGEGLDERDGVGEGGEFERYGGYVCVEEGERRRLRGWC
ncbi:hypothetical protein B0T25DRAFT_564895 [Lasiosphaeria hispida]|uniref:DUF7730 domain-containing protein n=1 Tax=Lasiosphaeria hispida TaxID=260671 RepID=A0AAJ0MID8_9PEZI|nr:hypothetical protein B0T25DRAFT_564895 [Lasiosphaeria hispida]